MSRLLNRMIVMPYYAPDDTAPTGGNTGPTGTSREDIIDFLSADDDTDTEIIDLTDKPKDKDDKDTKDDKTKDKNDEDTIDDNDDDDDDEDVDDDDDLEELEQELNGPTEEQLELMTPARRKEILKKYPEIFKDFPSLEKAYYREQQFTELFPTINDAKEAADKSKALDNFDRDLMSGNTETILSSIKKESPDSFYKIVDNYLGTLAKVDDKAYHHVIGNIIKQTIGSMAADARAKGDEDLLKVASKLNEWVFGTTQYTPPSNISKDNPDTKKVQDEVKEKERQYVQQRFTTAKEELSSRVNNSLRATIEANIDPRESMTAFVKGHAIRDTLETVSTLIEKDSRFKNLVDRLWEKAVESNFDRASIDKIRSAYVSKARTLLPSVIKKARNEALKGMGKRVREDKNDNTNRESRPNKADKKDNKETPSSRERDGRNRSTSRITKASDIPAGMSSLEFLMDD